MLNEIQQVEKLLDEHRDKLIETLAQDPPCTYGDPETALQDQATFLQELRRILLKIAMEEYPFVVRKTTSEHLKASEDSLQKFGEDPKRENADSVLESLDRARGLFLQYHLTPPLLDDIRAEAALAGLRKRLKGALRQIKDLQKQAKTDIATTTGTFTNEQKKKNQEFENACAAAIKQLAEDWRHPHL